MLSHTFTLNILLKFSGVRHHAQICERNVNHKIIYNSWHSGGVSAVNIPML